MDGNRQGARGRGRASTQNIRPGGRRPGETRQQGDRGQQPGLVPAPQPAQPAWGQPPQARGAPSTISGHVSGPPSVAGMSSGTTGPRPSVPPAGAGRATLHRDTKNMPSTSATAAVIGGGDASRGAVRGNRVIRDIVVTRPTAVTNKRGSTGRRVNLAANYFRLVKAPKWNILQYRVDFSPDIELLHVRRALIREHREKIGGYIFDGTVLFVTRKLPNDVMEFVSKNRNDEAILITVRFVGVITMYDGQAVQVLNLILRRAMEGLNLQLVGRNFFDAVAKIDLRDYRIELWPGYTTSIRQHEQDILLCVEIAHKVMRTERIYDILQKCVQETRDYQEMFKKEVMGMIVLTDYNNKTYRIDDVCFDQSPSTKFPLRDGSEISFVDYYSRKYNIRIRDQHQPLLASQSTDRSRRAGQDAVILLIPELCRATGLSDEMRSRFELMRAMADHTRLAPAMRIERLKAFNQRLYNTPASIDVLGSWDMTLDKNLVELPGRILKQENIVFGNGKRVPAGEEADWTREFRNNSMFLSVALRKWCVVVPQRSTREAREFIRCIRQAAQGMRMEMEEPQVIELHDDRNATYIHAIEQCCGSTDPQLVMCVVPNNNAERYGSIKKKTTLDRAIPTQVVVFRTIAPKRGSTRGLMSIATKVVIQMNCKLMGAPWNIELPLSGLMTIGFDVCHSARDTSKSYGGIVATMDLKSSARFYSAVSVHTKGNELCTEISINVVKALQEYRRLHGTLPARIILYRDGVGEGQFHQVAKIESEMIRNRLNEIYANAQVAEGPRFAFVIVSKRINTRYFLDRGNPPPGTVVDDVITLPERYDFFLVSQSVRQGTVTPTHYSIVDDNIGLDPDKMQILTYKMTHLYYNWSGTTRVPAVCQYAHKLAFLVAQSINQPPSNLLEKQLYFL